jgi:hypothetical protein
MEHYLLMAGWLCGGMLPSGQKVKKLPIFFAGRNGPVIKIWVSTK